jgi:translation initiation factor IF-3
MEVLDIAKEKEMPINEQIRAKQMLIIGPHGEQLGIKSKEEALTLASYAGFDLVLINDSGEQPVCKLMDYNKFKYEKKKKLKESQKKQKESNAETKEYRLSPNIDIHDFNTKLNNAKKYLEKGHKIKLTIRFKGREMQFTDKGKEVLLRFAEELNDVATLDSNPTLDGRNMIAMLSPVKGK